MYLRTQSSVTPDSVKIEQLPDGRKTVRLTDNVTEKTEDESTVFEYDEVVFDLPADREGETVETITKNFSDWWLYGQQEPEEITLEQRISELEEIIMSMMEEG